MASKHGGGAGAVLRQVGELNTVISQYSMNFIRHGFNEIDQKILGCGHSGPWE